MKLAISNIAWTKNEEPAVAAKLKELGVRSVEIAPTKVWDDPLSVTDEQLKEYLDFWAGYGITVVAFQAMFFPRPDLKLFESAENRAATLQYTKDFLALAEKMHAGVMVYGSPKNRQRGDMPLAEAEQVAVEFFSAVGDEAHNRSVYFCIEPNAPQYNCDFITNAQEGIDFVRKVDNPGFGLHLDTGCMTMAGEDLAASITAAGDMIRHFHISAPMLESVTPEDGVQHAAAAQALQALGYDNYISIEMKPYEEGQNLARVETAVRLVQDVYASK